MFYLLFSVAFLVSSVRSQYRFDCEDFCKKEGNKCPELNCENGRIVKNATTCGCCHVCIESLGEGKDCVNVEYGWSQRLKECGPGLVCSKDGKCVATECLKKLRKYEAEYELLVQPHLKPIFGCDHFGNYEPVVCISDTLCFCVDNNGKRIFGTDFAANNKSMNCDCSRSITEFPKEVDDEKLPRCLQNGNYDPLQCTGDKCFCMESSNPSQKEVDNDASSITELPCYNNDRHADDRKTKCLKEREEQMELFKNENLSVIGMELTRCDLDGSYFPVKCNTGRCFCVDMNGKIYEGYGTKKKKAKDMTCRCLRDKEMMKNEITDNMKYFEELECDKLGNYKSKNAVISESFFNDFMKDKKELSTSYVCM